VLIILIFFIVIAAIAEIIFLYKKDRSKKQFWLMTKGYICFLISLIPIGLTPFIFRLMGYLKLEGIFFLVVGFFGVFAICVVSIGFLISSCVFFASAFSTIIKDKLLSVLFAVSHIAIALTSYVVLGFFVFVLAALGG
jgi:hypothetical protein